MSIAIPFPNLWIPRPKKLSLPSPTWAMAHMRKKAHHIAKSVSHHIARGCGSNRYIQAKSCNTLSSVDIWFRLVSGDDTRVVFMDGTKVHIPFKFKIETDCYFVNNTCTISTVPGTTITDIDAITLHSTCECGPDDQFWYPAYSCCFNIFVGFVLADALADWQGINNTNDTVLKIPGFNRCIWIDTRTLYYDIGAASPINIDGYTPAGTECRAEVCCCCEACKCGVGHFPITGTLDWSFTLDSDGIGPGTGCTDSQTLSGSASLSGFIDVDSSGFATGNMTNGDESTSPHVRVYVACDPYYLGGKMYVPHVVSGGFVGGAQVAYVGPGDCLSGAQNGDDDVPFNEINTANGVYHNDGITSAGNNGDATGAWSVTLDPPCE